MLETIAYDYVPTEGEGYTLYDTRTGDPIVTGTVMGVRYVPDGADGEYVHVTVQAGNGASVTRTYRCTE